MCSSDLSLEGLESQLLPWVQTTLGPRKAQAFVDKIESNPEGLETVFRLVETIRDIKNDVIDQLDQQTPQIRTRTGDVPGGEGWVYRDAKLVPRHRWTPN